MDEERPLDRYHYPWRIHPRQLPPHPVSCRCYYWTTYPSIVLIPSSPITKKRCIFSDSGSNIAQSHRNLSCSALRAAFASRQRRCIRGASHGRNHPPRENWTLGSSPTEETIRTHVQLLWDLCYLLSDTWQIYNWVWFEHWKMWPSFEVAQVIIKQILHCLIFIFENMRL